MIKSSFINLQYYWMSQQLFIYLSKIKLKEVMKTREMVSEICGGGVSITPTTEVMEYN